MKPLLKIKQNGETIQRIEVDGLKAAIRMVDQTNGGDDIKFIYSTVNQITRIENTVTIIKR